MGDDQLSECQCRGKKWEDCVLDSDWGNYFGEQHSGVFPDVAVCVDFNRTTGTTVNFKTGNTQIHMFYPKLFPINTEPQEWDGEYAQVADRFTPVTGVEVT